MFIEVMYADLSRRRVQFDQIDSLPKTGVLFIVLSTPKLPRTRKDLVDRIWGWDTYAIATKDRNFIVKGWDDEDEFLRMRSFDDPHGESGPIWYPVPQPRWGSFPDGWKITKFYGESVHTKEWERALRIFNEEMY